jgi:tetratricopeptide (TPR) repeat protein
VALWNPVVNVRAARYRKGLILFEAERYDAALEAFNLAINVDENVKATYADLYYHRGLTHAYLGDQESAVSDFREAVRLDDQNFAAWLDLGRLLMHDEKFEEAIDCCNKALHIDPDNVQVPLFVVARSRLYVK